MLHCKSHFWYFVVCDGNGKSIKKSTSFDSREVEDFFKNFQSSPILGLHGTTGGIDHGVDLLAMP